MANKSANKASSVMVLGSICLIASILLAATYHLTAPKIEEITVQRANEARAELMPEATSFSEIEPESWVDGVSEIYKADNGTGYVITSEAKGFGGTITVMVAFDNTGAIKAVKVTDASNETPGLGSKVTLESYTSKYIGRTAVSTDSESEDYVDGVSGATYSSKGVLKAVSAAVEQHAQFGGVY